jgi:hypothetical protein
MNMHSAYGQHRFFVYHSSLGTSNEYAILEEKYIEGVRFYYISGIEPWYFKITWTTGTPTYYPESWFWLNYQEAVMALTYEDWNDPEAFNFDSTANAMLRGIADYLDINTSNIVKNQTIIKKFNLFQNYPNPFNPSTNIEFELNKAAKVELSVFDTYGRNVADLLNEPRPSGRHKIIFDAGGLATGVYFYQLKIGSTIKSKQMLLIK